MHRRTTALTIVISLTFTATIACGQTWLNFSGWDHSDISDNEGQTFEAIYTYTDDDGVEVKVDVTVRRGTSSTGGTSGAGGTNVLFYNDVPGSQSFSFVFSEDVRIVVETRSVDEWETHNVRAIPDKDYRHKSGAVPILTLAPSSSVGPSGMSIRGVDRGGNASKGMTRLSHDTRTLILEYETNGHSNRKTAIWRIGIRDPSGDDARLENVEFTPNSIVAEVESGSNGLISDLKFESEKALVFAVPADSLTYNVIYTSQHRNAGNVLLQWNEPDGVYRRPFSVPTHVADVDEPVGANTVWVDPNTPFGDGSGSRG